MKLLLSFFFILTSLFASHVEEHTWQNGESYLVFLKHLGLNQKQLYHDIDKEDKKLTEEIRSGVHYQILINDETNQIQQILIPLNDELQIHIYKINKKYNFETIPIINTYKTESLALSINFSPYYDILKKTGSNKLASIFMQGYKNSLNFKNDVQKGDRLAMIYEQKYRLGHPFSMPELKASVVELNKRKHFIYLNKDQRYYDEKGKQVEGFLLGRPVRNARITSRFTLRRWHPILHRYRAHLGVDYGARRGTPIYAAGSGRIIFAGRTRGYGNLIKIRHKDGYMTLYAHQKRFARGIHRGKYVKKGQLIGYVGSTGLSTGPHLHFGLYKHGRPINPLRVVQVTVKKLHGKQLRAFKKLKQDYDNELLSLIKTLPPIKKQKNFIRVCYTNKQELKDEKSTDK